MEGAVTEDNSRVEGGMLLMFEVGSKMKAWKVM